MDCTPYSAFENLESAQGRPLVITIRRADNGYIVSDGDITDVIEEQDSEHGEVFAAAALLWRVLEMVGHYGSKHDPARVRVRVEGPDGEPMSGDS